MPWIIRELALDHGDRNWTSKFAAIQKREDFPLRRITLLGKTTVILSPYSIHWPEEFARLSQVISEKLGKECLAIEHVGSTAVPGILAKPILDIDVVIPSYDVLSEVTLRLNELGYSHQGDLGIPDRVAFKRHDDEVPWTSPRRKWTEQHLYVCPVASAELRRHVRFRDILRSRDDLALDYERRKMEIAARSKGDRRLYAQIKEVECREWIYELLEERPNQTAQATPGLRPSVSDL